MGAPATIEGLLPVVRAMATRLSKVTGNRVPADDLSQIGLLAVHAVLLRPGSLDEDRLRARAGAAARNAMIDMARVETRQRASVEARQASRTVSLGDGNVDDQLQIADPGPGPEAIVIRRQMARLVAEAIDALPRRLQDVLRLSYEGEHTRASLAELWGLSAGRISQMHLEAIAQLRSMLAPDLLQAGAPASSKAEMFAPDIVKGASSRLLVE